MLADEELDFLGVLHLTLRIARLVNNVVSPTTPRFDPMTLSDVLGVMNMRLLAIDFVLAVYGMLGNRIQVDGWWHDFMEALCTTYNPRLASTLPLTEGKLGLFRVLERVFEMYRNTRRLASKYLGTKSAQQRILIHSVDWTRL